MDQQTIGVVMFILFLVGLFATAVYYFARYYFKTDHDKDAELKEPGQKDLPSSPPAFKDQVSPGAIDLTEPEKQKEPAAARASDAGVAQEPALKEVTRAEKIEPARPVDLNQALEKTRSHLFGRIKNLFSMNKEILDGDLEELEEILYTSDLGPTTVQRLLDAIDENLSGSDRSDLEKIREALKSEVLNIFQSTDKVALEVKNLNEVLHVNGEKKPQVWMIVGVNGAGKTTTIGKLAHLMATQGKKVLVAAGDTFRAAAGDQLKVWSERAQVEIFHPEGVSDPSAVAFDACQKAASQDFDIVIVDTAGRLHTQKNLMEELAKMKRVIQKVAPEGPHEVLLVLDANSGQNALVQARSFHEAIDITGVVLTKMDGTAKGGVAVGVACELGLPIKLIGVGESMSDLRPFQTREFVDSIL